MAEIDHKLDATERTNFGKGAARKIRAAGEIPAVLYGHGEAPRHLTLPGHKTMLLLRQANAVIEINIEGDQQLALVKDVQRDPVRQIIEHVDLVHVRRGERVDVDVPVSVTGESAPGTIVIVDANSVAVSAEATNIPTAIEVDVEGLEEGTSIMVQDLKLPKGVKLQDEEAEHIVLSVQVPQLEQELEELEAELEAVLEAESDGETPAEAEETVADEEAEESAEDAE